MNVDSLWLIARARGLNQSDLARLAGVSRQAVSGWRSSRKENVGVRDHHLMELARGLRVPPTVLTEPIGLRDDLRDQYRVEFLWDGLYPDVESFALALAREEPRALGRLVSRVGLFEGAAIAGDAVWKRFRDYERWLPPSRRKELEQVWALQSRLGLV